MIRMPKHVLTLEPYRPGKPISEVAREKRLSRIVKLASNENPLGPSPMAVAALQRVTGGLHRYPDPQSTELVSAISDRYGRNPAEIVCGHGTDALLGYIVNTFTLEQDELLTSEGSFVGIYVNTRKLRRKLHLIPLRDYAIDLDALAGSISADTRIVYLANPNNPTGTMFSGNQFETFMSRVPDDVLVVLDEAYYAYAAELPDYRDGLSFNYENLIVTRSLSKVYGLAGLRIGFAVGPEYLISAIAKVKLPFEPNLLAQTAAVAALDDSEFVERTIETNRRSLERLGACFDDLGIRYVKPAANFILILLPTEGHALRFFEHCLDRGLVVRPTKPFGVANGIRICSGTADETAFAVKVIQEVCAHLHVELT